LKSAPEIQDRTENFHRSTQPFAAIVEPEQWLRLLGKLSTCPLRLKVDSPKKA
jgi:hypothetical protein